MGGDYTHDTHRSKSDGRLFTSKEEWSELVISRGQQNELSGFNPSYENYLDEIP